MVERQTRSVIFALIVAILALFSLVASVKARTDQDTLTVDGNKLKTEPRPIIRYGRIFIPAMSLRKLGLAVEMLDTDSVKVAWPESDVIKVYTSGKRSAHDGMPAPFMYENILMLPLRGVVDGKIMQLQWNRTSKIANVQIRSSWKRWRIENDSRLQKEHPGWYETPVFSQTVGRLGDGL